MLKNLVLQQNYLKSQKYIVSDFFLACCLIRLSLASVPMLSARTGHIRISKSPSFILQRQSTSEELVNSCSFPSKKAALYHKAEHSAWKGSMNYLSVEIYSLAREVSGHCQRHEVLIVFQKYFQKQAWGEECLPRTAEISSLQDTTLNFPMTSF